jgi:hypothetical protein
VPQDRFAPEERLRRQALGLLAGFALQFLLGTAVNLFVTIPTVHPGTRGSDFFARSGHALVWALSGRVSAALTFHVYLGLVLVLGTVGLLVAAVIARHRVWTVAAAVALVFTLAAFFNGLAFLDDNENANSMVMATAWLVSVGALVYGLVFPGAPAAGTAPSEAPPAPTAKPQPR